MRQELIFCGGDCLCALDYLPWCPLKWSIRRKICFFHTGALYQIRSVLPLHEQSIKPGSYFTPIAKSEANLSSPHNSVYLIVCITSLEKSNRPLDYDVTSPKWRPTIGWELRVARTYMHAHFNLSGGGQCKVYITTCKFEGKKNQKFQIHVSYIHLDPNWSWLFHKNLSY